MDLMKKYTMCFFLLSWSMLCIFSLSACTPSSVIGGTSTKFYILAAPPNLTGDTVLTGSHTIGILPISLPEYLDTYEIVLRSSNSTEIILSSNHRWAESLNSAFQDVLSQSLSNDLRSARVVALPLRVGRIFEYKLTVDVKSFEGDLDHDASLKAYWLISGEEGQLAEGFFTKTLPVGKTFAELTQVLSKLIENMASDIARQFIAKIAR